MRLEAQEFLHGLHIATLATFNPRGSIHLAAVWYAWDPEEETLSVPTGATTRKAKNVMSRSDVSIMVDSRAHGRYRGVAVTGQAAVLVGGPARERNAVIHRRYITPEGMTNPEFGALHTEADDVTIVVAVERSRWWNLADVFDPELESRCLYRLAE